MQAFDPSDPGAIDVWLRNLAHLVLPRLSPREMNALRFYKEEGYSDINGLLRNGPSYVDVLTHRLERVDESIRCLDSALTKCELREEAIVFRGLRPVDGLNDLASGDAFTDYGFLSTTLNETRALEFAPRGAPVLLLEIRVQAGSNAVPLDGLAQILQWENRNEQEVLVLGRGKV